MGAFGAMHPRSGDERVVVLHGSLFEWSALIITMLAAIR
jgi:hypothetical protein